MDDRRGGRSLLDAQRPDEAVFDVGRVGAGSRGWPVFLAIAVALALGGMVVAGTLDREDAAAVRDPSPAPTRDVSVRAAPVPSAEDGEGLKAGEASTGSLLALQALASGRFVFVHGEVFTPAAEVVRVSIRNVDGRTLDRQTVTMPGESTALRLGASDRFEVAFEVEAGAVSTVAYVLANAYDDAGTPIASARQAIENPGDASGLTVEPVRLELPAADVAITDAAVAVRGTLRVKADSVRVELLAPDRLVISEQTVETSNVDGGIRPVRAPGLDLRLELGTPRPVDAQLWLVITAFDEAGSAIGFARREVTIGELERPGPW